MIKGVVFRGIDYKCAMLYFNNGEWQKSIKAFESIVAIDKNDANIYEMMSKCYSRLNNADKYFEYLRLAINSYESGGESEKVNQLRAKLK